MDSILSNAFGGLMPDCLLDSPPVDSCSDVGSLASLDLPVLDTMRTLNLVLDAKRYRSRADIDDLCFKSCGIFTLPFTNTRRFRSFGESNLPRPVA